MSWNRTIVIGLFSKKKNSLLKKNVGLILQGKKLNKASTA
jgi:hypothetical protein